MRHVPIWNCGKIYQNRIILVLGYAFRWSFGKFLKDVIFISGRAVLFGNDLPGRQAAKKIGKLDTLYGVEVCTVFHTYGKKTIMLFAV